LKHEITPEYRYIVGDAADAYWDQPQRVFARRRTLSRRIHRELVHVLPGYVVVYDRVTLKPNFATVDVEYVLNTRNAPRSAATPSRAPAAGTNWCRRRFFLHPISP